MRTYNIAELPVTDLGHVFSEIRTHEKVMQQLDELRVKRKVYQFKRKGGRI